ncbi:UNVERIFIED_CONTAM: hypothetical protein Cloal_3072 [Acetivibrio alkalicellulosi]
MNSKDILNEYPYILKDIKKLNCELDEIVKNKEIVEEILKYNQNNDNNNYNNIDPTLKAVERVLDRYVNNILYMTGKINNLKELKNKIDNITYHENHK